jgi:transcriptional regulator with XRE-family HTH domain
MVVPKDQAIPNLLLRQARESRQLTQDEVADELGQLGTGGVTGGLVSKWERGICRPSAFHRRLLCQFFEATAEQLGFGRRLDAPPDDAPTGGLLKHAGDTAVAARQKRSTVDPTTLDELDQDVERFALECLGVPHADLVPQVWDHWQRVEQLLDGRQSLNDRTHLTLLGGQLTYFLSRLSFNLGDYTAARRHAVLAWQYAEDIGQAVLCASVKTMQGTISFYAGQHHRALDYLQAAERYDNPYNRPRIAANRARVYAVLGERREAEQTLATMERHLVALPVQPGDSPYTPATGMSALATTFAWLGDGEIAEGYARQAVALHNRPGVRHSLFEDRGNATLNLAASLVARRQPEPEEAARLGMDVMAVPEGQRTETVRKRGTELLELLRDWRSTPAVRDYAEALREYRLLQPSA